MIFCTLSRVASTPRIETSAGGLFTRADALAAGHSDDELGQWVRDRQVRRLRRGIYGTSDRPQYAADRVLEQGRGLAMRQKGNIALSHHAALVAHGIATHDVPLEVLYAVRLAGAPRSGHGLVVVRPRQLPPVMDIDGVLVVRPEVAIVQVACNFGFAAGVVAADSALHRGLVTRDGLAAEVRRVGAMAGISAARMTAEKSRVGAESAGETLLRLQIQRAGFDVELQFPVAEPGRRPFAFVDLRITGTRSLWEFDGAVKYEGADGKRALMREKVREDRIRDCGWGMQRVIWRDLRSGQRLRQRVEAEVRRCQDVLGL